MSYSFVDFAYHPYHPILYNFMCEYAHFKQGFVIVFAHRVIRSFLLINVGKRRADSFWLEYQIKFSITQSWHNAALMHICI